MLKRLVFIAAFFCLSGFEKNTPHTADYGDWTYVGGIQNKAEFFVYLNSRISGYYGVRMWVKKEYYEEQQTNDGKSYIDTRLLYLIDCKNQSYKILSSIDYNQIGEEVNNVNFDSSRLEPKIFIPDTVGYKIYKAACDK